MGNKIKKLPVEIRTFNKVNDSGILLSLSGKIQLDSKWDESYALF